MQQHDGYHKEYYWLKDKLVRFHFIKVENRHTQKSVVLEIRGVFRFREGQGSDWKYLRDF